MQVAPVILQAEDGIGDELTGSVIGDLSRLCRSRTTSMPITREVLLAIAAGPSGCCLGRR